MTELTMSPRRLQIVTAPHPVLEQVAHRVDDPASDRVAAVAKRMLRLVSNAHGLGLAANQVGLPWRMFVVHVKEQASRRFYRTRPRTCHPDPIVFINPVITWSSEETTVETEGCLSIPGLQVKVRRPAQIEVEFMGLDNIGESMKCAGMLARCIQHEMDHINGIQLTDKPHA